MMLNPNLDRDALARDFESDRRVRIHDVLDDGAVAVVAGETWNFQGWHRDAVGGSATSNFTQGVSVTFQ